MWQNQQQQQTQLHIRSSQQQQSIRQMPDACSNEARGKGRLLTQVMNLLDLGCSHLLTNKTATVPVALL
jgi:hypothetical protein